MYKITSRAVLITAIGIAVAVGAGGVFLATRNTTQAQNKETASSSLTPQPTGETDGGLVVFIDPVTGQIRQPDAAEIGTLSRPATRKAGETRQAQPFPVPGGGVGMALDPSFDLSVMVTKTADGKLKTDCVVGQDAAAAVARGEAKAPTKEGNTPDEK